MKKQKKQPSRKRSFFVSFCLIALSAYFVISLVTINHQIDSVKDEITNVSQQTQMQNAENKKLRDYIDNDDMDGYIEEVARDKLGYVMPGERVYYDVSVNN